MQIEQRIEAALRLPRMTVERNCAEIRVWDAYKHLLMHGRPTGGLTQVAITRRLKRSI
jgi:hypothetical protein